MLTYFQRYKMRIELDQLSKFDLSLPAKISMVPYSDELVRAHARVKHESFQQELDAIVFPCLGLADGCLKLMNDIRRRSNFVPEATFLATLKMHNHETATPVGTIQGMRLNNYEGSIQNIGVIPEARGKGIGRLLIHYALQGFYSVGCRYVDLEVTTHNTGAVRLYKSIGFQIAQTVFKASEVPGV
jgi:ribosomal protein S18 acetylase RimI-like enzyme